MRDYEIVTFFANTSAWGEAPAGEVAMIDMLHRSALAQGNLSRLTLLTDRATWFSGLNPSVEIRRYDVDAREIMLARTTAQARYLAERTSCGPVALLDTDILVNGRLADVFDGGFDVAVTYRPRKALPVNAGVILLDDVRRDMPAVFLARLLDIYLSEFAGDTRWWGDQKALNRIVAGAAPGQLPADAHLDGFRIRFLDAARYNHAPARLPFLGVSRSRERVVLHFKSAKRKAAMERYFKAHFAGP